MVTLLILTLFHVKFRCIEIQLIGDGASHTEHLIQKEEFTNRFFKFMITITLITQAVLPIISIILHANFNDDDKKALLNGEGKSVQQFNESINLASWAMIILNCILNLNIQFLFLIFMLSTIRLTRFMIKKRRNRIMVFFLSSVFSLIVQISILFI